MPNRLIPALLLFASISALGQQTRAAAEQTAAAHISVPPVLERDVLAHEEFLASDVLHGRGSATRDEWIAATYVASQFRQFGLQPAGDAQGENPYIQRVAVTAVPRNIALRAGDLNLLHGKDIAVLLIGAPSISAALQKLQAGAAVQQGSAAYVHLTQGANDPPVRSQIIAPLKQGAAMVLVAYSEQIKQRYEATLQREINVITKEIGTIVILGPQATKSIDALPDGTSLTLSGDANAQPKFTYNTIGVIKGSIAARRDEAILITAHVDHLGENPRLTGDTIFNGADDDASGVVAVLELARAVAKSKPSRTVYFVTFGSEETGGQGAEYFREHPPIPLTSIVANLEFEMLGRADPKLKPDQLYLTGYERSNLGPELAKHGAKIVADPHLAENFFERSDNYTLAKKGVVAQTVSSYGLHKQYHQPDDDIAHLDLKHMTEAINSMVAPVIWLTDSAFKPEWRPGKKP